MTKAKDIGALIAEAMRGANLSQRALADQTDISQSTICRILSGERLAKMPEIIQIAWATGRTVAQLSGMRTLSDRVQCAARATDGSDMNRMRGALLNFLELDEYLDRQGIRAS
ncbi:hypothetical protein GCM10009715_31460 [Paeniglutamicibacter psychrophenolicus]|uniref:Transcriptional regulator with XRE-family HTH domain n=1 Tax=Paeniglutamicibacter psychrophenolicus TaxID=257454 RepID=A0ABS4W958_9MICC|nr:helix-turn-helix transcriptional regulator [Paeniglutamicibacter psychrophenolicus]MBP2372736.1 transcriptional regulator with XRE-family HTH domain [Paeniglutamicibacter psychrophenolicus]